MKHKFSAAERQRIWLTYIGKSFEAKCLIPWCLNRITVFDFHVGHNIPETFGGSYSLDNVRPICKNCNLSMGHRYTQDQWSKIIRIGASNTNCCCCWFSIK